MNTVTVILIVAFSVLLICAAGLAAMLEFIFRTTFSRSQPKAVAYHEPPREKMNPIDQKRYDERCKLEQLDSESWVMTTSDGVELVAHYIATENARRTVLMLHGWRSTWARDFGMHTDALRRSGANLLFVEQRAHGESGGKYIGFGALEQKDCLQWLSLLREKKPDGLPIYLFGISMGAATVLMASGSVLPDCVKGIIADSGFTSPAKIIEEVMKQKKALAPHFFTSLLDFWTRTRAGFSMKKNSTLIAMQTNRTPVLFIHGKNDTFVPLEMTLQCYEACKAEKSLLLVDKAPHAKAIIVAPELYEETICKFFGDNDA